MDDRNELLVGKFTKNHYNLLVDRQDKLKSLNIDTYSIMTNDIFSLYVDFDNTNLDKENIKIILYRNGYEFNDKIE